MNKFVGIQCKSSVFKTLLIGDPHFKKNNLPEIELMVDSIITLIDQHNPNQIVCLGDILDTHEKIDLLPQKHAIDFLYLLSKKRPTYAIIGNHDRINNSDFLTENHPFSALKYWNNITIVDKAIESINSSFTINKKEYKEIYLPYVPNGRFYEALSKLFPDIEPLYLNNLKTLNENYTKGSAEWIDRHLALVRQIFTIPLNEYSVIYAHQEFYNCKMGAIKSVDGDLWPPEFPPVYSGHIHDYQRVTSIPDTIEEKSNYVDNSNSRSKQNVIYVGTPIQHAFGDSTDKTVMIITISSDGKIEEERFDLGLPKRIMISLKWDQVASFDLEKEIEKRESRINNAIHNIRITISGRSEQVRSVMKLAKVKSWKNSERYKVKVVEKIQPAEIDLTIKTKQQKQLTYIERLSSAVLNSEPAVQDIFNLIFPNCGKNDNNDNNNIELEIDLST